MTVTLRYTEAILRRAIWSFIKKFYLTRMIGVSFIAVLLVALAFFQPSPWISAFVVVPALTIPGMLILGYYLRVRESLKRLSLLDDGQVVIELSDWGICLESAVGTSETKWFIYTELWEFPTHYLLLYTSNQFVTIPRDQVTPEFIAFIRLRLKAV